MSNTLDDIIKLAEQDGLIVREENIPKYLAFLEREIELHGYDLNLRSGSQAKNPKNYLHLNLLADMLYLRACLMGEMAVKKREDDEGILLSDEYLYLLRVAGSGKYLWEDENLFYLYIRREFAYKKHKLMRYTQILDYLGKYPEVVSRFGRELTYQDDIAKKVHKARKLEWN